MAEVVDLTLDESSQEEGGQAAGSLTAPQDGPPAAAAAVAGRRRRPGPDVERPPPPAWLADGADPWLPEGAPTEDGDWSPSQATSDAGGESGGGGGKKKRAAGEGRFKPKRTREQIAQEAEEKRQRKAEETRARKEQRLYDSDRHVMCYVTAVLDPEFLVTPMGLAIAAAFQQTQARAEHERIAYRVAPTGLLNLPAMRWQRKVPAAAAAGEGPSQSQSQSQSRFQPGSEPAGSAAALIDADEPHVLLCFEAEDFVARVLNDGLREVFGQLARACPGARPHLVVHRLSAHLQQRERAEHRAAMAAGAQGAGFLRRPVDDFVARLAIECPGAAFREVRSADEAAAHACAVTVAIARRFTQKSEAGKFLGANGGAKKGGASMAALLAAHPVAGEGARAAMGALCALPSMGPQIAHAVVQRHGSLGGLMDALFDPGRGETDKVRDLEGLQRVGPARAMRVGPKAARQLYDLLTSDNPNLLVHGDAD